MKRVLIIAYFFPPVSSMGSHRILRFVRHLREFGWEPAVLTGATPGWRLTDQRLVARLPKDLTVCRVGGIDLTEVWKKFSPGQHSARDLPATAPPGQASARLKTQGLTTWLNRWVMIPDKYFPWIRPATASGEQSLGREKFDAIYSTSDPLSDHLVGLRLARKSGVPWVAEFRDLWMGTPYFARGQPTPLHRRVHARMERRVVENATALVALSTGIRRYFETAYRTAKAQVIYNCYEPEDYPPPAPMASKFTVLYAGALYSSRSPETFLDGFARFVRSEKLTPGDAEFACYGGSPDLDLDGMVARLGLSQYVRFAGFVQHGEVLRQMQTASVLLTIQSPADDVHVPGKLFEYIGARRPILAVSQPCEVTELVNKNNLGWVAEPNAESVAATLAMAYRAWRAGTAATAPAERFAVGEQTRQLAELLHRVSR